jgi:hypothetical protein
MEKPAARRRQTGDFEKQRQRNQPQLHQAFKHGKSGPLKPSSLRISRIERARRTQEIMLKNITQ